MLLCRYHCYFKDLGLQGIQVPQQGFTRAINRYTDMQHGTGRLFPLLQNT